MDYKFLNKVLGQIVNETTIDYDEGVIKSHFLLFLSFPPSFFLFFSSPLFPFSFSDHCEDVYGLNKEETEYVWEEYKYIIKDKIMNNGL